MGRVLSKFTVNLITVLAVLALVVSGMVAVWHAVPAGTPRAVALLWCFACLSIGLLSGFLFAIPRVPVARTVKQDGDEVTDHRVAGLGINTNLEEISDWLTKILVGIGLVEASKIKGALLNVGAYLGRAFDPNSGSIVATGMIVLYLGLGFLSGFLVTRLFLSPSLRHADEETGGIAKANQLAGEALDKADATLKLYDVLDAAYSTWIDHRKRAGANAQTILPPELARSYLTEFKKFSTQPKWALNRRLHMLMANFYFDVGDVGEAMDTLTRFVAAKDAADEVDIHMAAALYNRACYHARLFQTAANDRVRTRERQEGLADLARDISICPSDAAEAKLDDDFRIWQNDPDFQQMTR